MTMINNVQYNASMSSKQTAGNTKRGGAPPGQRRPTGLSRTRMPVPVCPRRRGRHPPMRPLTRPTPSRKARTPRPRLGVDLLGGVGWGGMERVWTWMGCRLRNDAWGCSSRTLPSGHTYFYGFIGWQNSTAVILQVWTQCFF